MMSKYAHRGVDSVVFALKLKYSGQSVYGSWLGFPKTFLYEETWQVS